MFLNNYMLHYKFKIHLIALLRLKDLESPITSLSINYDYFEVFSKKLNNFLNPSDNPSPVFAEHF